ncbi:MULTISPECIES: FliH/SctL family protein [unclassified Exiguobacterium]|uniref:FliH/SctL family protein n=1 Tax=unclassified Exiguobacterium TaxID=2644629 RepID=UPI001F1A6788|nr:MULTISPECIES: FliH/SctL family protein [unclassified Exiguobacterium]
MTSLSNVIKRQRAMPLEPQRIDSRPFLEPFSEVVVERSHEQELEMRYASLRQEEEAIKLHREAVEHELELLREQTLEAAYQEGYGSGFDLGRQEGKSEFDELTARLNTVGTELENLFEQKWRDAETKLVDLAVEISARVTTDLVRNEEALFADMIREQLLRQIDAEALTVFVHPTRLASIQRFESMWQSEQMPPLKYRADVSLTETSVRIETPHHGNELDVSYSFERIRSKIEEVLSDGAY